MKSRETLRHSRAAQGVLKCGGRAPLLGVTTELQAGIFFDWSDHFA